MKRVLLFLLTNILIIGTVSILMSVFGLNRYFNEKGIDYRSLLIFCAIWGMGGAFISLALSKVMAKWMMGVKIIKPNQASGNEAWLITTVHNLAKKAGMRTMPEVGIYESEEVNAFATGPSQNSSLVAVSSGLLNRMSTADVEGVLGHEIAHIVNGDMVTMTLIQGVVNAFTMFLARVIAYAIQTFTRDDEGEGFSYLGYYITVFILDIIFSILGSMVVAYFSRLREYRADYGGAKLAGKEKMISALDSLRASTQLIESGHKELATLKISGKGLLSLFSTHPPLEERIKRLKQTNI